MRRLRAQTASFDRPARLLIAAFTPTFQAVNPRRPARRTRLHAGALLHRGHALRAVAEGGSPTTTNGSTPGWGS